MPARTSLFPAARLYESLRTAHLERAHETAPASILYRVRRYDFDESLSHGLDLIQASPMGAARLLFRSDVTTLEVNEPLMLSSLPATALALLALGARRIRGGPRVTVVTYAIGNADPFDAAGRLRRARSRLRRRAERLLARSVWRRVDRVAFGTPAAEVVYTATLGRPPARTATALVPALPTAAEQAGSAPVDPFSVLFVGALSERKGIRVLLEAWPRVSAACPGAILRVLGKGPLEDEVRRAARDDPSITLEIDPPRRRIHEAMATSTLLVLPSQPSPTWREQVGLPIVEALSHGCTVVTTRESGLADWLAAHGHGVYSDAASPTALGSAILVSLEDPLDRRAVLDTLPERDGRLAADDWLFA